MLRNKTIKMNSSDQFEIVDNYAQDDSEPGKEKCLFMLKIYFNSINNYFRDIWIFERARPVSSNRKHRQDYEESHS